MVGMTNVFKSEEFYVDTYQIASFRQGGTWPRYLKIAYDRTTKKIEEHKDTDNKFNENLAIVFYKYRDILDASYCL